MSEHYFFIPCLPEYWELPTSSDPAGSAPWIRTEASRTLTIARRLFPDVQFRLCEEPPLSQTYERGSLNQEIRRVLELGTALRFDKRRR